MILERKNSSTAGVNAGIRKFSMMLSIFVSIAKFGKTTFTAPNDIPIPRSTTTIRLPTEPVTRIESIFPSWLGENLSSTAVYPGRNGVKNIRGK